MPEEKTTVVELEEDDDDDNVVDFTEELDEEDDDDEDEKVIDHTEKLEEEEDNENPKEEQKDGENEDELWKNFKWDMTQLDMEWEEVLKAASVSKEKLHDSLQKFLKNKRVLNKWNLIRYFHI